MVTKEMCNKFCLLNRDAENVEWFSESCLGLVYNGLFQIKKNNLGFKQALILGLK